jgi:hypothetical protein
MHDRHADVAAAPGCRLRRRHRSLPVSAPLSIDRTYVIPNRGSRDRSVVVDRIVRGIQPSQQYGQIAFAFVDRRDGRVVLKSFSPEQPT